MKRFISLLLCALMLCVAMPFGAFATENTENTIITYTPVPDFYDSEELFATYVEREFYPEYAMSVWGTSARDQLNEYGKKLYDSLKLNITAVANGSQASAVVTISSTMLRQWGVTYRFRESEYDASGALAEVNTQLQSDLVIDALLHDCPYDLYWFDKSEGWGRGASFSISLGTITVTEYVVSFSVAQAYQGSNYNEEEPIADKAKTGATATAVANADAIVAKYSDLNDYEKIKKYKEEICGLVEYNDTAAKDSTTPYGDPWQMIYVFDKNTSTNVVCEGYSKAFQYLCDKSTFQNSNIACYTVSGVTAYNGGQGGHMWNILTMDDGKNYIADITNSDTGTVGEDGELFLSGMNGSVSTNYAANTSPAILYAYDSDIKTLWGIDSASILNLSATDYTVSSTPSNPSHTCSPVSESWVCDDEFHYRFCSCGNDIDVAEHTGAWIVVKETENGTHGLKEYRCTVCNYRIDWEIIPDSGNDPAIVVGDINGNGKIDARDYLLLKRAYFGTYTLDCDLEVADINGNGKIDARDYLLLKRAYFGTYVI